MVKLSKYIINEMQNYELFLNKLDDTDKEKIRNKIEKCYIDFDKKGNWMWERFISFKCVSDSEGWRYIKDFVQDSKCVMFFNIVDDSEMILFENGEDLSRTISETYGFEFYITDMECSYLICFNHHDILYGCGRAEDWISEIFESR